MISYTMELKDLTNVFIDTEVSIRGRVHTIRGKGGLSFIVIRDGLHSIQIVVKKNTLGPESFKSLTKLPNESVIDITGTLSKVNEEITFTSFKTFEIQLTEWELISQSGYLPFSIDDASFSGDDFRNEVLQHTRLNSRWLDLRTSIRIETFKIMSTLEHCFREFVIKNGFTGIHTPKLISTKTEGGSNVFDVNYFKTKAYLAQSPQLYKQMMINSDFKRVFEVGPVFRAENCISHRHLCEYTGLDIEMEIPIGKTYHFVLEFIWKMLRYMVSTTYSREQVNIEAIHNKIKFSHLVIPEDPFIINFEDGVKLLNEAGFEQDPLKDLSTANEKELGKLIKEAHNSDLFILDRFPLEERPFYTMPLEEGSQYSRSYDIIMRGEEISSGAQRVHQKDLLVERIASQGINPADLKDYINSFSLGSKPHAGCGIGLERVIMLLLDLGNIRNTSLFPRDPKRINP